ncbi:MAG: cryptochrome/photolyase family protein [Pseudomonadota bacterium]
MKRPLLVWFREDLRVDDQRALLAAVDDADARGVPVHAVWCAVPQQWDAHGMGDNRRWFVLAAVRELAQRLAAAGIPLAVLDAGDFSGSTVAVARHAQAIGAAALYFNDEYPLNEVRRDAAMTALCAPAGIQVCRFHDGVLVPPDAVFSQSGTPYTVFTPYRQAWYRQLAADPLLAPRAFRAPAVPVAEPQRQAELAATLHTIDGLQSALSVPATVRAAWEPGEREAQRRLKRFTGGSIQRYRDARDLPAEPGTSTLSPYLAAGCLSPRRALAAARGVNHGDVADGNAGIVTWISELAWRDFYRQVMFHFPHVAKGRAFRRGTDAVPWRCPPDEIAAWQEGRTGYPLVDAAMRQLVATGWMHNRLRMVTAMFLSKDLLVDWRIGERFFAQHLVDWDFAANNGGWQWSASTGTDAAPYFRLFNPVRQGERFDPEGRFVRHWLPELRQVPDRCVHAPWLAGRGGRRAAADLFTAPAFPEPIIDHAHAKARVLAAFRAAAAAGDPLQEQAS